MHTARKSFSTFRKNLVVILFFYNSLDFSQFLNRSKQEQGRLRPCLLRLVDDTSTNIAHVCVGFIHKI